MLATADPQASGASGPRREAEAFAAAWSKRTGSAVENRMRMRLFALDRLIPPAGVPGAARPAASSDVDLLGEWRAAFSDESGDGRHGPDTPRQVAERSLLLGSAEILWEIEGAAVSLASARRPVAGMSRIGPVYTPSEHRNHGYAAAATAAVSRWSLDAGAEWVLLFTDLANRTSNALCPRLGFRPVHDALEVVFVPGPDDRRGVEGCGTARRDGPGRGR